MYTSTRNRAAKVAAEVLDEVESSTAKHGDQGGLPDGTGPGEHAVVETAMLLDSPKGVPVTNGHVADAAKKRCRLASRNEGGDGTVSWEQILTEEWAEALAESDPDALRSELIQVAAVAVKWVEAIDRRSSQ